MTFSITTWPDGRPARRGRTRPDSGMEDDRSLSLIRLPFAPRRDDLRRAWCSHSARSFNSFGRSLSPFRSFNHHPVPGSRAPRRPSSSHSVHPHFTAALAPATSRRCCVAYTGNGMQTRFWLASLIHAYPGVHSVLVGSVILLTTIHLHQRSSGLGRIDSLACVSFPLLPQSDYRHYISPRYFVSSARCFQAP